MNCLACEGKNLFFLHEGKDRLHAISGTFSVVKCATCGLRMLDPQPSIAVLNNHYPKTYHAYAHSNESQTRKYAFAVYLYNLYFSKNNRVFEKILFLPLRHLLRGTCIRKNSKLLDVGCGNGSFLLKMRSCGLNVEGVEFSDSGAKEARSHGLDVATGTLEQQKYPASSFDVITLNHVLEHVRHQKKTMNELARILKSGGVIILAVPNARSLAAVLFGKYWASLDVPRHLATHTPHTIELLAKQAGLVIKNTRYISFPFQFQASLAYVLHPKGNLALEETWVGRSRFLYWLFMPLVYAVDLLRLGDVIEISLMKK